MTIIFALYDVTIIANDIGRYLVRKVENNRNEIGITPIRQSERELVPPDKPVVDANVILRSFRNLSEQDIFDLIQKSAQKSCVLDPLPTTLVCDSLDVLLPFTTKLVNNSPTTTHFPTEWKQAIVNPLLKKGAKNVIHKNLRPINNLQFVSKVTEISHMTDNELFPVLQSAYRKGHSTETAILRVVNDILSNVNKQHVSILVLLDPSAAFDTVEHAILLRQLEASLGITDAALAWFSSCLSRRIPCHLVFLRVRVSGPYSSVPMPTSCSRSSSCTCPTHSVTILSFIFPSTHTTPLVKQRQYMAMEQCIRSIRAWMQADKLKLHENKTEVLLIGTRQQLSKVHLDTLTVGDTNVAIVNKARNLGVGLTHS